MVLQLLSGQQEAALAPLGRRRVLAGVLGEALTSGLGCGYGKFALRPRWFHDLGLGHRALGGSVVLRAYGALRNCLVLIVLLQHPSTLRAYALSGFH